MTDGSTAVVLMGAILLWGRARTTDVGGTADVLWGTPSRTGRILSARRADVSLLVLSIDHSVNLPRQLSFASLRVSCLSFRASLLVPLLCLSFVCRSVSVLLSHVPCLALPLPLGHSSVTHSHNSPAHHDTPLPLRLHRLLQPRRTRRRRQSA